MKYFITGGAGFIGSNMTDRLLCEPENEVVVYDNFSTGRREFLAEALKNPRFHLIEGDNL
ncbi:MAG TPA: GDP-mannose 4,6-dehydratase, partial [Lachnospiraceae bacterium]|nr:GDP-mannose 4,6-dehydratase [Lachnospiraceae bacterium]